jgi:predicted O-methyltransferase YrrM
MKFEDVRAVVDGIPFMEPDRARVLYDFIVETRPQEVLEIGFAHGVGTCYMAAALDEIGQGHLTSVDLVSSAAWQDPSIEELVARAGLQQWVTVAREKTSYTWFLKKKIEERSGSGLCSPVYDLCLIDATKNWQIDGFGFFLVDKLLRTGGWIVFDDLKWTYEQHKDRGSSDGIDILALDEDEITQPHIELIFRLLVMQSPSYGEFRVLDDWWAWAHKIQADDRAKLVVDVSDTLRAKASRALSRLKSVLYLNKWAFCTLCSMPFCLVVRPAVDR